MCGVSFVDATRLIVSTRELSQFLGTALLEEILLTFMILQIKINKNRTMRIVFLILLSTILCFFSGVVHLNAQVTVGSGLKPEKAALLDIKEHAAKDGEATVSSGAVLMPRVYLAKKNELFFIPSTDPDYAAEKLAHRGLTVYNLSEIPEEDLEKGLYIWTGEEWVELQKSLGKAVFGNVDCSNIQVYGAYTQGVAMNGSNYITISLNVIKPGSYLISAATGNGYSFSASGTAFEAGPLQITLTAQGKPANVSTDHAAITGLTLADPNCKPEINVAAPTATYFVDCAGIVVNGVYQAATPTSSANTVTVPVTVTLANPGANSYNIYTNTVDGLSFSSAQGAFFSNTGPTTVTLYANGTPTSTRTKTFSLTINSADGATANCTFNVVMVRHKMTVYSVGEGSYALSAPTAKSFLNDAKNFGANGLVKMDAPFIFSSGDNAAQSALNAKLTAATKPDIVTVSYNFSMNASNITNLINYVNAGGVLIYFGRTGANGRSEAKSLIDGILGTNVTVTATGSTDCTYPLMSTVPDNDPIINGPFGNVKGGYWGEDNDGTFYVTGLPSDVVVYSSAMSSNSSSTFGITGSATMFRSTTKNFMFTGDTWGHSDNFSSSVDWPSAYSNNTPSKKIYGNGSVGDPVAISNAILYANMLAWAIEQAQFYGINSASYK
jgi:hypothetical protein